MCKEDIKQIYFVLRSDQCLSCESINVSKNGYLVETKFKVCVTNPPDGKC